MNIVIITGLSGAGKSTATKIIEDMGYFCIDNLPPSLIPKIVDICSHSDGKINKVAIIIDSRAGNLFEDMLPQLSYLKDIGHSYKIIFLDASDEILVKRFKENRRLHPLAREGRIMKGIKEERKILKEVKEKAEHVIDTSDLSPKQFKEYLIAILDKEEKGERLFISIYSFGFKYTVPIDVDLVFDVRFIPNPFYIEALKKHTGKNEKVKEYILNQEQTQTFLEKTNDMLEFLIPNYIEEGKSQLVIGIGCTGGQHRSVVIAESLYKDLKEKGHKVAIDHRDIYKTK